MSWTDVLVTQLENLWAQGFSASQIAGALGGGISRNAVIGKAHRMKLNGRALAPISADEKREREAEYQRKYNATRRLQRNVTHTVRTARIARAVTQRKSSLAFAYEIIEVAKEDVAPIGQGCTILELNEHTCRWPIGDPARPDFYFCGALPLPGLPYCGAHCRLAYTPSPARSDKRPVPL
jgi:GcrA cell cycle regulator